VVNGLAAGAKAAIEAVDQLKNRQLDAPTIETGTSDPA
jgi:hypothetical protein